MNRPGALEDVLARTNEGWGFFEGLPEHVRKLLEPAKAKDDEDRKLVAAAWAEFAESEGGRLALQHMFDSTLNRTVFFVNLGQEPQAMAMWGCFREGQNALAHEIARQIAIGRNPENAPNPRENNETQPIQTDARNAANAPVGGRGRRGRKRG